ncbi:MAG: peptidase MA family metallohydrolase [Dehalococcoidia bacterium]
MKRLCLLLMVAFALLIAFPGIGVAQDEITVISSDADPDFPYRITFNLEAESTTEITDIDLAYRLERLSLAPISYRVDADFTPGPRVNASWTWNMLETGGLPPGVEVEYWWLIEDATGQKIESSPATVKFDDLSYDWSSLTSDQVTLYWYEGDHSFAEELIDAADEALERLASDTGVSLEQPARFYIYASFEELRGALVYPYEWTGGLTFTDYGIIAIGISPDNLTWGKRTVAHELAHLVIQEATFGPYGDLPTWLNEGLATYAEGELESDFQFQLNKAVSEDELISVRSLSSSFPADPVQARLSYAQSYSLVRFLLDNYGKDKLLELLDVFKEGSGYDDALLQVYGFDMDGLNALWRASLGLEPQPTPTPTVPLVDLSGLFSLLPTILIVGLVFAALFIYLTLHLLRRR